MNLILASDFVTKFFPVFRIVLVVLMALSAITIIVTTLMQSTDNDNSTNVITGQESYYSQNKGASKDAKLKKITVITSIVLAVCCVLYFVSFMINMS